MPTVHKRKYSRATSQDRLTDEEVDFLISGPIGVLDPCDWSRGRRVGTRGWSPWADAAEERKAVKKFCPQIMALIGRPECFGWGTRPWCWWEIHPEVEALDGETEFHTLSRLGLLLPGELEEIKKVQAARAAELSGMPAGDDMEDDE